MSDKIKLVADEQTIEKLKQKQERRRMVKSFLPKEPIQSPNDELIEVLNQLKESLNKPPQDQPEHDKKKDEQQKPNDESQKPNDESQKQRDEEIQRIRDEEVERKKLFESIVQRHNSLVERFNQIVELKDDRIKELENEIKRVLERREIANAAAEKPQEDINHVLQEVIDKKKPIMKNYSKPTQSSIKKK
jgi:hypothetical protein